jgi:hypothetical protein
MDTMLQPDLELRASISKDAQDREQVLASRVQLISAASGEGTLREDYWQALLILMTMAALVLFVGCVNLANLQLSRLLSRQRELVVRTSLARAGGGFAAVTGGGFAAGAIGAALAVAVGAVSSALLLRWASGKRRCLFAGPAHGLGDVRRRRCAFVDRTDGVQFVPRVARHQPRSGRHLASRTNPALQTKGSSRISSVLLTGQVSLSVLLVGVAGLFAQTLRKPRIASTPASIAITSFPFHLDFSNVHYEEKRSRGLVFADARTPEGTARRARHSSQHVRDSGVHLEHAIHVAGHPEIPEKQLHGEENHVSAGYFRTMGIPVLRGREFEERDGPTSPKVAVLNHSFARQLFGVENPIGHKIGYQPAPHDADYEIVGEVADARVDDLRSIPPPVAYFSTDQRPAIAETIEVRGIGQSVSWPRRLAANSARWMRSCGHKGRAVERRVRRGPLAGEIARAADGNFRCAGSRVGRIGILRLIVVQCRQANRGDRNPYGHGRDAAQVHALVLRQTLWILVAGIVPGIVLTEFASRGVQSLLYGSGAIDVWALMFAIAVLAMAGFLAAWRPARARRQLIRSKHCARSNCLRRGLGG